MAGELRGPIKSIFYFDYWGPKKKKKKKKKKEGADDHTPHTRDIGHSLYEVLHTPYGLYSLQYSVWSTPYTV